MDGLDGQVRSEHRVEDGDAGRRFEIGALALEAGVGADTNVDVEIARLRALPPGVAFTFEPECLSIVDAGGDVYRDGHVSLDSSFSGASATGLLGNFSGASTARADRALLHHAEKRLLRARHLADAATLRASDERGALLRAKARALGATGELSDGNCPPFAHDHVRKVDHNLHFSVRPALVLLAGTGTASEETFEQIRKIDPLAAGELREIEAAEPLEPAPAACSVRKRRVAELIVGLALLRIIQGFVRLIDLLELPLGFFVTLVLVWMPFLAQFPIRLFHILGRRLTGEAKNGVIILCHAASIAQTRPEISLPANFAGPSITTPNLL